jgi:methionine synthase I (cobalamin-dependent)
VKFFSDNNQLSNMGTTNTSDGSLHRAMSERILILDGAMGTMIQRAGLSRKN